MRAIRCLVNGFFHIDIFVGSVEFFDVSFDTVSKNGSTTVMQVAKVLGSSSAVSGYV